MSLSDKAKPCSKDGKIWYNDYPEEDVKEFIRLLKEKLCVCVKHDKFPIICKVCKELDELAGEKLVK